MEPEEIFGTNRQTVTPVSFEDIENAFKTPTQYQHLYEQPEPQPDTGYAPSDEFPESLVNPDGEKLEEPEPEPHVDHDHAIRTGERIARLVDTGIDFTLSNFVAKNGESYRADERDLQDIAECWGELAEDKGWSIGPEWSLVILYIMVYGPLVKQAVTDRRMAELESRTAALEAQMKVMQPIQPGIAPQNPDDHGTTDITTSSSTAPSPYSYKPNA